MANRVYPLHCRCSIYGDHQRKAGDKCKECGTIIRNGLPTMREMERWHAEDKAIDRIMVT